MNSFSLIHSAQVASAAASPGGSEGQGRLLDGATVIDDCLW